MAVLINGLTAVHQNSQGKLNTTDVCLTPPFGIPIPFSNLAQSKDIQQAAQSVFINGYPMGHLKSIFAQSSGDAGGIAGISSGTINSQAEFLQGSPNVFVEGQPAVRANDPMVSNNRNTASAPLNQQPVNMDANVSPETVSEQATPTTSNVIDIDRIGVGHLNVLSSVAAYDAQSATQHAVGLQGDPNLNSASMVRHTLANVADTQTQLALQVMGQDGTIDIPLTTNPITLRDIKQTAPATGQAPHCLIPCRLAWQTLPYSQQLTITAGDLSDIARFGETTRQKIYQDLIKNTSADFAQTPWDQLISRPINQYINALLKAQISERLPRGWLYIYKDGFLWRELVINENGTYNEVDLLQEAGKPKRHASGLATDSVVLPYKINNTTPQLEIAYSPMQWTWSRINYWGGMDANDPRIVAANPKPAMPSSLPAAKQAADRSKRFIKLDLSAFADANATVGKTHSNEKEPIIVLRDSDGLPTILLPSALDIANRLTTDIQGLMLQLEGSRQTAMQDPYFSSALLAYRTYFDVRNAHTQTTTIPNPDAMMPGVNGMIPATTTTSVANANLEAAQYLDKNKLETLLRVEERHTIRELIKQLQITLSNVLENKIVNQPFGVVDTFSDLTANSDYNYTVPYLALAGFLSATTFNPDFIDTGLDIVTNKKSTPYTPAGFTWANQLTESGNNWFNLIFPDDATLQQFDQDYAADTALGDHITLDKIIETDAGDGSFNLAAYIQTARGLTESYEMFDVSIATILRALTKATDVDNQANVFTHLAGWLRATAQPNTVGIKTAQTGAIPDGYRIVGMEHEALNKYSETVINRVPKTDIHVAPLTHEEKMAYSSAIQEGKPLPYSLQQRVAEQPIDLIYRGAANDANNGKVMMQFTSANVSVNPGASPNVLSLANTSATELAQHIYDDMTTGEVGKKINTTVFIQPVNVAYQTLVGLDRGMKTINLGLRAYNLIQLKSGLEKHTDWSAKLGYFFETIGYFAYSIEDLYLSFYNIEKINELYTNIFKMSENRIKGFRDFWLSISGSALTPLAFTGIVANMLDFAFAFCDLITQLRDKNKQEATLTGLRMGVDALTALGIFMRYIPTDIEKETLPTFIRGLLWADEVLLGVDPLLWVLNVAIVFIVIYQGNKTPFDDWAKASPFATSPASPPLDNQTALAKLLTVLFTPTLRLVRVPNQQNKQYESIYLDVAMPFFQPNAMQLHVKTAMNRKQYGVMSTPYASTMVDEGTESIVNLVPSRIEEQCNTAGNIQGMRYYYDAIPINPNDTSTGQNSTFYEASYQSEVSLFLMDYDCSLPPAEAGQTAVFRASLG